MSNTDPIYEKLGLNQLFIKCMKTVVATPHVTPTRIELNTLM